MTYYDDLQAAVHAACDVVQEATIKMRNEEALMRMWRAQ